MYRNERGARCCGGCPGSGDRASLVPGPATSRRPALGEAPLRAETVQHAAYQAAGQAILTGTDTEPVRTYYCSCDLKGGRRRSLLKHTNMDLLSAKSWRASRSYRHKKGLYSPIFCQNFSASAGLHTPNAPPLIILVNIYEQTRALIL